MGRRSLSTDVPARAAAARDAAAVLSGVEIESTSGMRPADGGGTIFTFEAVETRHVPNDRDIMCTLIVDIDAGGAVVGLRRERRYRRGDV